MLKPISEIKMNLGIEPNGRVQKFFTATCAKHMDRYVPADNYNLRETVILNGEPTSNVKTDTITYTQPYAHAQYVGYTTGPVRNYTTPRNRSILG
jgi:hypothetical protein